jgi:DNA-binding transcriptional ArsR family regulator
MGMPDLGPISRAMFSAEEGEPPAIISEWLEHVEQPGDIVFLWAAAGKPLSWTRLTTHFSSEDGGVDPLLEVPPMNVERLLAPMAHEGRVRIMQSLYEGAKSSSELTEATGFRGGGLYHHLRALRYAAYVREERGRYGLTQLGRQLLITMTLIAREVVVDREEEGQAVGLGTSEKE